MTETTKGIFSSITPSFVSIPVTLKEVQQTYGTTAFQKLEQSCHIIEPQDENADPEFQLLLVGRVGFNTHERQIYESLTIERTQAQIELYSLMNAEADRLDIPSNLVAQINDRALSSQKTTKTEEEEPQDETDQQLKEYVQLYREKAVPNVLPKFTAYAAMNTVESCAKAMIALLPERSSIGMNGTGTYPSWTMDDVRRLPESLIKKLANYITPPNDEPGEEPPKGSTFAD